MMTELADEGVAAATRPALLFVDDERRVLTSMRAMFRREFEVLLANSGSEALEILQQRDVHVVISDQRMPEMTGVEFLARVREEYPGSMRILLTGYADLEAVEASINESEVFRYLMKPCPTDELKDAVRLAVDAARSRDRASMLELESLISDVEDIELTDVALAEVEAEAIHASAPASLEPNAYGSDELDFDSYAFDAAQDADAGSDADASSEADGAIAPVPYQAPEEMPAALAQAIDDAHMVAADEPAPIIEPEILVLSTDAGLVSGIRAAAENRQVRLASSTEQALAALHDHPVGVLITDLAVNEAEIDHLTRTLKQEVPQLVTIIASDRSDAALLIGLINHGQIFRFLLKPLQVGQTRIWLKSAVARFKELCSDQGAVLRHRVARNAEVEAANEGLFANVRSSIHRLKERFAATLLTGLTRHRGD